MASLCPGPIRAIVPDRRFKTWPPGPIAAICTLTAMAVWPEGLLTTAKAVNPPGVATAPTFSTARAGAGVGVGTGVGVGRWATGDFVGCTADGVILAG